MRGLLAFWPLAIKHLVRCPAKIGWRYFIEEFVMKPDIHPKYAEITATCTCGNVLKTGSTLGRDIHLDVCSACHPFYTGKQKVVDTGGRIDRFNKRFGARGTTR
jgi:large subunit ribosomal protein L31